MVVMALKAINFYVKPKKHTVAYVSDAEAACSQNGVMALWQSFQAVIAKDCEEGERKLAIGVSLRLGHFLKDHDCGNLEDFTIVVSWQKVSEDGSFWLVPMSSYSPTGNLATIIAGSK